MAKAVKEGGLEKGKLLFRQVLDGVPYPGLHLSVQKKLVRCLDFRWLELRFRGFQIRLLGAPVGIYPAVPGDAEDPGGGRGLPTVELFSLAPDGDHHFLAKLFGQHFVRAEPQHVAFQAGGVEIEQFGECGTASGLGHGL